MELHPSLEWRQALGMAGSDLLDALHCDGYEVARLIERINGGWFAVLRYPDGRTVRRNCASFSTGKTGCDRWALRHLDELQARSRRKQLELIAGQPWRGNEAANARTALQELQK